MGMKKNGFLGDWVVNCDLCFRQSRFSNMEELYRAGWSVNSGKCVCNKCMEGLTNTNMNEGNKKPTQEELEKFWEGRY